MRRVSLLLAFALLVAGRAEARRARVTVVVQGVRTGDEGLARVLDPRPGGIRCGRRCTRTAFRGERQMLLQPDAAVPLLRLPGGGVQTIPNAGASYDFLGFTGCTRVDGAGILSTCVVDLKGRTTVTATFRYRPVVTVQSFGTAAAAVDVTAVELANFDADNGAARLGCATAYAPSERPTICSFHVTDGATVAVDVAGKVDTFTGCEPTLNQGSHFICQLTPLGDATVSVSIPCQVQACLPPTDPNQIGSTTDYDDRAQEALNVCIDALFDLYYGKGLGLNEITKRFDFPINFSDGGTISVQVHTGADQPTAAVASIPDGVELASGSLSMATPGAGTLELQATSDGKKLFRANKKPSPLTLTVTSSFTPLQGQGVTLSQSVTLQR